MIAHPLNRIGRYEIIGKIAMGQMNAVYKAQDPTIGRIVALKVVHVEEFPQPDVLTKQLQNEAKLAGNLRHPSIVTIHDAGEDENGNPFIVMEYLEGPTLAELMESGVSSQQAIDIALQLCDALNYAHEQGMIHGDLKPSNIKVLDDLEVKITDFGLARPIRASAAKGAFTGTLAYASPEQLRGEQIDERADIFSLGTILFEMLTGSPPFENSDLERDKPSRERLNCIPSDFLRNVLLQALHRDAEQRHRTCATLGNELGRYKRGDITLTTENPFICGPPITEPEYFYGRRREIQTIVSRLKSVTPGSSAIVGGRRIGKTSLLRTLCHPHVVKKHGLTDKYVLVYLYSEKNQIPEVETQLWQLILTEMRKRMHSQFPEDTLLIPAIDQTLEQDPITSSDFKKIIAATFETGLKVVLLFDEFQHIVGNEAFSPGLFGVLRDLTQRYNLAFVTTSGKNLKALATAEIRDSPFWNVFISVYLEPFSKEEAYALVKDYIKKTDVSFTEEDVGYVTHISGGHPYFLQLACWLLFNAYREGKQDRDADREKARQNLAEEFVRQAEPHFAHFWEQSSEAEKRVLIVLVYRNHGDKNRYQQHERPKLQPGPGLKALSEHSLVIRTEDGNYRIFSPLFAKWIRQHVEANFDDELEPHFRYLWEQTETDERRALRTLARRGQGRRLTAMMTALQYRRLIKQPESSLDALMKQGMVVRTDSGDYKIFTPLYSKWILRRRRKEQR